MGNNKRKSYWSWLKIRIVNVMMIISKVVINGEALVILIEFIRQWL